MGLSVARVAFPESENKAKGDAGMDEGRKPCVIGIVAVILTSLHARAADG